MDSLITPLPYGTVNEVNLPVIGMTSAVAVTGTSLYQGTLGKTFWLDADQVKYNSSVGTNYGGRFRWVQLSSGDGAAALRGQVVFWDTTVVEDLFTCTTNETKSSTPNAVMTAGIVLSTSVTPGNYTVIQDVGRVQVKFRAVLTDAGVTGSAVYAAGAGAGADNALCDVLSDANPALFSDVSLMLRRFLGTAVEAPVGGQISSLYLHFQNLRG